MALVFAVTPGRVTAALLTSVTIAANDGTSKTFAIDGQTIVYGKSTTGQPSGTSAPLANGDTVVVVALNNSTTATAVIAGGDHGFGPPSAEQKGQLDRLQARLGTLAGLNLALLIVALVLMVIARAM